MTSLYNVMISSVADADRPSVVSSSYAVTWGQLQRLTRWACKKIDALQGRRVALAMQPHPVSFALAAALDHNGCETFLIDGQRPFVQIHDTAMRFKLSAIISHSGNGDDASIKIEPLAGKEPGDGTSTVTILTSGTTGISKAATHTWQTLLRPVRHGVSQAPVWLLTYPPHLYAGLQVMVQCLERIA